MHIVGFMGFYVFGFLHYDGLYYYAVPGTHLHQQHIVYCPFRHQSMPVPSSWSMSFTLAIGCADRDNSLQRQLLSLTS